MNDIFRFRIAFQTIMDYKKTTLILTLLFMAMAVLYCGMFPAFKEPLEEMADSGIFESFSSFFGPSTFDMATYVGFLNLELYQIFWIVILGIIIGFVAASLISKEIEGKTIDILMSNPVSRKQIVFEKFIGLIPMTLIINFGTMLAVMGITVLIGEELSFGNLFLTHVASIPYFLSILGIGMLLSVIIDEKMKASIIFIALLMGMYFIETMSKRNHSILATKADKKIFTAVKKMHTKAEYNELAKTIVIRKEKLKPKKGMILVITAGTSDIPVAEEAVVTAEIMGNKVEKAYDVGVAGVHRLFDIKDKIFDANVIIVVAGMEGALASIVGGLASRPVIAVPTSVGYGASFKGIAPLLTMMNSCAEGIVVVNIDNGFGAGYFASLINR